MGVAAATGSLTRDPHHRALPRSRGTGDSRIPRSPTQRGQGRERAASMPQASTWDAASAVNRAHAESRNGCNETRPERTKAWDAGLTFRPKPSADRHDRESAESGFRAKRDSRRRPTDALCHAWSRKTRKCSSRRERRSCLPGLDAVVGRQRGCWRSQVFVASRSHRVRPRFAADACTCMFLLGLISQPGAGRAPPSRPGVIRRTACRAFVVRANMTSKGFQPENGISRLSVP
jgi:hypothetical protein